MQNVLKSEPHCTVPLTRYEEAGVSFGFKQDISNMCSKVAHKCQSGGLLLKLLKSMVSGASFSKNLYDTILVLQNSPFTINKHLF